MKTVFSAENLLLPRTDPTRWAVIACDQFTSQPEYWREAEKLVGDAPSALRVVLPEVYLGQDEEARVAAINRTMREYTENGVLEEHPDSMIYVERQTRTGVRHGLIGTIDLDDYDFRPGSDSLIRATEQTVLERIPPRVRIRRDAPLELPHVLLLMDDPDNTVLGPLGQMTDHRRPAYDFDLMLDGGHIRGDFLDAEAQTAVAAALARLQETCRGLLFAVGDGNHSLATAKSCVSVDPASHRALVELVNLHDPSLVFEPIYRVLFHADVPSMWTELTRDLEAGYTGADAQRLVRVTAQEETAVTVRPTGHLPVATLQGWLDGYLARHPEVGIDYIHGEDTVRMLCREPDTVGFLFDGMRKDELFEAVRADGALPRKTFSMGTAHDKRYYFEARRIRTITG